MKLQCLSIREISGTTIFSFRGVDCLLSIASHDPFAYRFKDWIGVTLVSGHQFVCIQTQKLNSQINSFRFESPHAVIELLGAHHYSLGDHFDAILTLL